MTPYIKFKLWKLGIFLIGAFIYGFITGGRKRSKDQPPPSEGD